MLCQIFVSTDEDKQFRASSEADGGSGVSALAGWFIPRHFGPFGRRGFLDVDAVGGSEELHGDAGDLVYIHSLSTAETR